MHPVRTVLVDRQAHLQHGAQRLRQAQPAAQPLADHPIEGRPRREIEGAVGHQPIERCPHRSLPALRVQAGEGGTAGIGARMPFLLVAVPQRIGTGDREDRLRVGSEVYVAAGDGLLSETVERPGRAAPRHRLQGPRMARTRRRRRHVLSWTVLLP